MKREIFGIPITIANKRDILEEIKKYLQKPATRSPQPATYPLTIFTPNPEIIAYSLHDRKFKEIVAKAQINLPDGIGIVWALQKLYGMKIEKIAGADFMRELSRFSAKNVFRIGLIGGREKVALRLAECLKQSYNNLRVEVFDAPEIEIKNEKLKIKIYESKQAIKTPQGWQADPPTGGEAMTPPMVKELDRYFLSLVNEIINRKIDILFVALGHPKQEYFISLLSSYFSQLTTHNLPARNASPARSDVGGQLTTPRIVLMAVGGSFDYLSGRMKRAPLFLQRLGLEWLYRFIKEPWRFSRQLQGAEFFYRVLSIRNLNTS